MAKPYMIMNNKEVKLLKEYKLNTVVRSLQERNYITPKGYDIWYSDVKDAVRIMNTKHCECEWVNYDVRIPKINLEGYFWLEEVYFNSSHKQIDADVIYFEMLVEKYIQTCNQEKIDYDILPFVEKDMTFGEIAKFVNRKINTVRKAYYKLPKLKKQDYYYLNKKRYIPVNVIEELCRKYFKHRYLKYLEQLYLLIKKMLSEKGVEVKYE